MTSRKQTRDILCSGTQYINMSTDKKDISVCLGIFKNQQYCQAFLQKVAHRHYRNFVLKKKQSCGCYCALTAN